MSTGDSHAHTSIEELKNRMRTMEKLFESYLGYNWEALRPTQVGGLDLPADDGEVKRLAFELKSKRSEITDVKKLHMVDMVLHFFSLWPVLPQVTRRYAYNMGTLLTVAMTEGWNEATQRCNGFGPQLVVPALNGQEPAVARSSITAEVNGVQATPVADTSVVTSVVQAMPEPASMSAMVIPRSPPRTPIKREAADEAMGASSPKVPVASTSSASSGIQSPSTPTACPLSYKPKCGCKQPALRLQVRKDNQNKGRYFYKCFKSAAANPIDPCTYFEWEDTLPAKAPKYCSHCGKPGHNKNNCPAK